MSCWNCCISKQYFLSSFVITKILSANRTIPILYVSCFCTGCCFAFCLTQLMPSGRNHCGCKRSFLYTCFITKIFFANTAVPVFCISCFCTGCFLSFCLTQLMTCRRNHCGCKRYFLFFIFITKIFFANTAVPVFRISCFCTGSCFAVCLTQLMPWRSFCICQITVIRNQRINKRMGCKFSGRWKCILFSSFFPKCIMIESFTVPSCQKIGRTNAA